MPASVAASDIVVRSGFMEHVCAVHTVEYCSLSCDVGTLGLSYSAAWPQGQRI
jgi:hypothetical protein